MKVRILEKELKGYRVVLVDTNKLRNLFNYIAPNYYSKGVYGHNGDYWQADNGIIFADGDRPYYNDVLSKDDALFKKYFKKAKELEEKYGHFFVKREKEAYKIFNRLAVDYAKIKEGK